MSDNQAIKLIVPLIKYARRSQRLERHTHFINDSLYTLIEVHLWPYRK
jgi:hypothetical protein